MPKDRTSAKTTPLEGSPASVPSVGEGPKSRERLKLFAHPRHLKILSAEHGKALIEIATVSGWKPVVRDINGEGVFIRFKGLSVVAES
jgi:hypothetical protein